MQFRRHNFVGAIAVAAVVPIADDLSHNTPNAYINEVNMKNARTDPMEYNAPWVRLSVLGPFRIEKMSSAFLPKRTHTHTERHSLHTDRGCIAWNVVEHGHSFLYAPHHHIQCKCCVHKTGAHSIKFYAR